MAGVWNWIEFFFVWFLWQFIFVWLFLWLNKNHVRADKWTLSAGICCNLLACSLGLFSSLFFTFLYFSLECFMFHLFLQAKKIYKCRFLMCFTLFSEGLSSNLLVCVCAHLLCFVFLEFMFKRPFVPISLAWVMHLCMLWLSSNSSCVLLLDYLAVTCQALPF